VNRNSLTADAEWLEADGLGGFASGMALGPRTRRYHALLLVSRQPPVDRVVLVNGFDAWFERDGIRYPLSSQRYAPGVIDPRGADSIVSFRTEPWPIWRFVLPDETIIEQELVAVHDHPAVALRWRVITGAPGRLVVRPFLSGRDAHALHHENADLRFDAVVSGERVDWQTYGGMPPVRSLANASYQQGPLWYRQFELSEEAARGFDALEDLAAPGTLSWMISINAPARWLLAAGEVPHALALPGSDAADFVDRCFAAERDRRAALGDRLARAADAYVVRRGEGRSIIAGYPWFTDWGRDTFIALRGLCLATERLDDARLVLLAWAGEVSEGMLPNRFIDQGGEPEYNAVDASLWYVIAVHAWQAAMRVAERTIARKDKQALDRAVQQILEGYAAGTRFGIGADHDGLLKAGVAGVQLTWMDAKVGDWVVTPRIGKPVEVQALWINALRTGGKRWNDLRAQAEASFADKFWNEDRACLYDVIDVDHVAGAVDASLRPNQLLAVGGLPFPLVTGPRGRAVLDVVERELWTPLGPRSLAPSDPGYIAHYRGSPLERDGAYHQGTVWPWLAGAFIDGWVRVRKGSAAVRAEARCRFLDPLLAHLDTAGLGHISEIADADPPHTPAGCPFQAWSVGEVLRIDRVILAAKREAMATR
jgi:predicted glycogen debranching enzyme